MTRPQLDSPVRERTGDGPPAATFTGNLVGPPRNPVTGRPPAREAAGVDLRGLTYDARRERLFDALRRLRWAEELQVISSRVEDVHWLRYESEAWSTRCYHWSGPHEDRGAVRYLVIRAAG